MQAELMPYLPEWFRQIKDFEALMDTETVAFEALADAMGAVRSNFYIQTADAGTIAQYEGLFGIIPSPQETMDFRRARVLNRLSIQPPFTMRFLQEKLDQIIGAGKWSATMDYPAYTLYIESAAENQAWANEVYVTLDTIKPCHIAYLIRPFLAATLALSQQVNRQRAEYHYRLGAWALGRLPFATLEDLGVIVMPTQPTIQPALLADTADFVIGDVASARLNGSVSIPGTALLKHTEAGAAYIEYTVTEAQTPVVDKVELLSVAGAVLTSAPVYVPVSGNVRFKHKINVKEGV